MDSPILHYHNLFLPLISALGYAKRDGLADAIAEMDYLIETLSYSELSANEREETELAYWAWWEKVREKMSLAGSTTLF
jgi:hypothetical protein